MSNEEIFTTAAAATPGKWSIVSARKGYLIVSDLPAGDGLRIARVESLADAKFIADARFAVPRLCEQVYHLEYFEKVVDKMIEELRAKASSDRYVPAARQAFRESIVIVMKLAALAVSESLKPSDTDSSEQEPPLPR